MHNWEAREEDALKKVQENQKSEEEDEEEEEIDKTKNNIKDENMKDIDNEEKNINNNKIFKKEDDTESLDIDSEENIDDDSEDKKDFDYNNLLTSIRKYCEQNDKEKAKYVDNKFLFLLCREGEMTKEELKKIEQKPELIEILLDTYIDMVKESSKEKKEPQQQQQKKEENKELFIQPDTRPIDDGEINREFFNDDNEQGYIPIPPPPPPPPPIFNINQKTNSSNNISD